MIMVALCFIHGLMVADHKMHAKESLSTKEHVQQAHGMYGHYPMGRDATGTSWMPGSTLMPCIHSMYHNWIIMNHGYIMAIYDHQGGPKGGRKFFSENMYMLTAQKDTHLGTLALRGMFCVEPGTMGARGYPLLLQTGETANGVTPLINRQHPHDFLMELAFVYTFELPRDYSMFLYVAMPGEPAIGPPAYIHRYSAFFNPEAPITHHWLDSTHVSFGVATIGLVHNWLKIDASIFTGREPDQKRWNFDRPRFDSYAIRFSANPIEDIAAQVSYAFLKGPEQLQPCVNVHRTTASVSYNRATDRSNWQTTFACGFNKDVPGHFLPGYLLESAVEISDRHILFGRGEYVSKDGLFILPPLADKVFKVGKLDAGYIFAFPISSYTEWGLGFVASASFVPHAIKQCYGGTPLSYMVFLRAELKKF